MNRRMPKMPPTTITYIWLLSMMGRRTTEVDDGEQTRRRVQEERGEMERSGEGIRRKKEKGDFKKQRLNLDVTRKEESFCSLRLRKGCHPKVAGMRCLQGYQDY
jgi:hypothetical protein